MASSTRPRAVAGTSKHSPVFDRFRKAPSGGLFVAGTDEQSHPAISLESVSKRFGSKTIVHDVTFTVAKGEIVGFLGPNGAGKTTTMRMIAGFTTASSGRVTVAGFDMATRNEEAARRLGYLPEHPPLYDTLDVSQYLRFVASAKGVPRNEFRSEIDRVATACRLESVLRS